MAKAHDLYFWKECARNAKKCTLGEPSFRGFSVAKEQVSLAGSFSAAIQSCLSPTTAAVLLCIHHHHHHHHHHHLHHHHGHHDHLKHVVCFFTNTTHRSPHLSFLYH